MMGRPGQFAGGDTITLRKSRPMRSERALSSYGPGPDSRPLATCQRFSFYHRVRGGPGHGVADGPRADWIGRDAGGSPKRPLPLRKRARSAGRGLGRRAPQSQMRCPKQVPARTMGAPTSRPLSRNRRRDEAGESRRGRRAWIELPVVGRRTCKVRSRVRYARP
jgi:hypothetical protein